MKFNFNNSYARLPEEFYHRVVPQGLKNPRLGSWNAGAAELLDLDLEQVDRSELVSVFSGTTLPDKAEPLAAVYAGHQFGVYVPRLGDGRAILLGEVENTRGEKWDLQLKGAGTTRYSRFGDGRAVLRSTIREYLCSEAMHALGIPTTRALCVIASDEQVVRESIETGAILARLSPSHVRFGTFEYFSYTNQHELLKVLADYVVAQHYPEKVDSEERYAYLYEQAVQTTAQTVAQWQAVGFAHGVMNTDNMSIIGLTIDYGPYGFLEDYHPGYICNHSDETGRYAFARQPSVAFFNLNCLANALLPLVDVEQLKALLVSFEQLFLDQYYELMGRKLGIDVREPGDRTFVDDTLTLLYKNQVDYTRFFRELADVSQSDTTTALDVHFKDQAAFYQWLKEYQHRCRLTGVDDAERQQKMNRQNPQFILRNYLAQTAIEQAEAGDFSEVDRLLEVLGKPFDEQPDYQTYAAPAPEWGRHLSISCSS